jgi:hypothetical protein
VKTRRLGIQGNQRLILQPPEETIQIGLRLNELGLVRPGGGTCGEVHAE